MVSELEHAKHYTIHNLEQLEKFLIEEEELVHTTHQKPTVATTTGSLLSVGLTAADRNQGYLGNKCNTESMIYMRFINS